MSVIYCVKKQRYLDTDRELEVCDEFCEEEKCYEEDK